MIRHNESVQQHNNSHVNLYQQHELPSIIPVEPPIVNRLYERYNIIDIISCELVSLDMH